MLLEPFPKAATGSFDDVTRASVRLVSNGAGTSLAGVAPQRAKLAFSLAKITQSRPGASPSTEPLATLDGLLRLDGSAQRPVFDASESELVSLVSSPLSAAGNQRSLVLELDPVSFGTARSLTVPLPEVSDDIRKLELRVDLNINGALESPAELNDILDSFFTKVEINETKIVSLKFESDHQVLLDNDADFSKNGKPIGAPEWKFGKPSRPIAHTKARKVDVEIELEVFPLNADAFDCTVVGEAIFEPKTTLTFRLNQRLKGGKFTLKLSSAEALPNQISTLKGVIRWTVEAPKAKKTKFDSGDSFGHRIFLTFGQPADPPDREAGITTKRMSSAVDLVAATGSLDPHTVIGSLMAQNFPEYTINKNKQVDPDGKLNHPKFFNDTGGAWRILENLNAAAECQAIVRCVRAIASVLGMPGTFEFILATVDADSGLPFEEDGATGRGLTDERRPVNGRVGQPFLTPEPPLPIGTVFEIGAKSSPDLNFFEACLRFTQGGKSKLYPGGLGDQPQSFDDVDAVVRFSFRSLILVSDVPPLVKDGKPRARMERVIQTYLPRAPSP